MSVVNITYRAGKSRSSDVRKCIVIVRGDLMAALTEFGVKKPDCHVLKAEESNDELIIEEQYRIGSEPL